jgi:hypothetical protein
VSETDKSFAIHIEGGTFPNWIGTDQKPSVTISGDELKWTTPYVAPIGNRSGCLETSQIRAAVQSKEWTDRKLSPDNVQRDQSVLQHDGRLFPQR